MEEIKLLSQRQTSKVLADGEVHDVIELAVLVDGFGPFKLDVPAESYHPDTIDPMVADLAWRVRTTRYNIAQHGRGG